MALNIGRKRQDAPVAEERRPPLRERLWPRRTTAEATQTPTRTVVVERKPRRWPRHRPNPVSSMVMGAGWAAVLILVLGMLLTLGDANPGNTLVDSTLDAGRWLATPFHDAFTRSNPEHQLYLNWGIAAAVYYAMARVVSWLIRF
ncbi:hypothetical protein ACGFNU_24140 [Spirillospora sp. NPDC048911]|uniref:hypothetical protein n=1 Tax=Spirillospora sp. NPDC048911 TaxID=3364527 RepID=UPI00371897FB